MLRLFELFGAMVERARPGGSNEREMARAGGIGICDGVVWERVLLIVGNGAKGKPMKSSPRIVSRESKKSGPVS